MSDQWSYTIPLDPGSARAREAAEAARVLVSARLEGFATADPALLNSEITRQVRQLFDGMSLDRAEVADRLEYAGSLLAALAYVGAILTLGGRAVAASLLDNLRDQGLLSLDKAACDALTENLPDMIVKTAFVLAERDGWTF